MGIIYNEERNMSVRKWLSIVLVAVLTVAAKVDANEGFYVGPSLSAYYLDSDRYVGGAEDAVVAGANLGYRFFNDWALELGVGSEVAGNDLELAKLDFYYWFGEDATTWRPYFTMGVAYYEQDVSSSGPVLNPDQKYTHQGSVGMGLSKMLDDHLEFRGDVRFLHQVREGHEGINDGSLNLALNYFFNGPKAAPIVAAEPVPEPEYVEPAPEPQPDQLRTITVRLNVEFEFDKAIVRAIYGDELQAVANAMKVHDDIELVLEGHTDWIGTDAYNQDLSDRRAKAVKAKLVETYGIAANRISTVGYGESRPIADNKTDEGRARNRRVIGELSYSEVVVD
ncbi:MAG TPA: hypothetical protein DCZ13_07735 [Porticoccaceae bacterium]|nr:hypothetical protein [Porticoccaceae bacterium]